MNDDADDETGVEMMALPDELNDSLEYLKRIAPVFRVVRDLGIIPVDTLGVVYVINDGQFNESKEL